MSRSKIIYLGIKGSVIAMDSASIEIRAPPSEWSPDARLAPIADTNAEFYAEPNQVLPRRYHSR